jgi:hypothetical protein
MITRRGEVVRFCAIVLGSSACFVAGMLIPSFWWTQ